MTRIGLCTLIATLGLTPLPGCASAPTAPIAREPAPLYGFHAYAGRARLESSGAHMAPCMRSMQ